MFWRVSSPSDIGDELIIGAECSMLDICYCGSEELVRVDSENIIMLSYSSFGIAPIGPRVSFLTCESHGVSYEHVCISQVLSICCGILRRIRAFLD